MISREIYEINGLKTFMKIKANAFDIGKVLFSFVEFNPDTKELKQSIDLYMDVPEMLLFCNDVLSGKLPKEATKKAESNPKFPPPVFTVQGGQKADKANRSDGKALARVLNFGASSRQGNFLFQALSGPGKELEKGLISMENPSKPEHRIMVLCSPSDLKKLCLSFQNDYSSYLSGKYARKEFDYKKS
mgnify:CR=1 FL=1